MLPITTRPKKKLTTNQLMFSWYFAMLHTFPKAVPIGTPPESRISAGPTVGIDEEAIGADLEWDESGLPIGVWRPLPAKVITPNDLDHYIDWIYVFYARGDLDNGNDRKNLQAVGIVDLNQEFLFAQIPAKTEQIYIVTREKLSEKQRILDEIITTNDEKIKDKYLLNVAVLPKEVQDELYDKEKTHCTTTRIKPVDLTDKTEPVQIKTDHFDPISDVMAWNGGPVTVGLNVGDTYASWVLLVADSGLFAASGTATQTTAISNTGQVSIANDVATFTMTLCGENFLTTIAHNTNFMLIRPTGTTGNVVLTKFNMKRTINASAATRAGINANTNATVPININHCMYNGNSMAAGAGFIISNNTVIVDVSSCAAYDAQQTFHCSSGSNKVTIENCTGLNASASGINTGGQALHILNCASFDSTGNDYHNTGSETTFTKCASSDLTGSEAGLQSLVAATVFESVISTESDFLVPVEGESLDGTGAAITIAAHTTYLNDVVIVAGDVDIGANGVVDAPVVADARPLRATLNTGISLSL